MTLAEGVVGALSTVGEFFGAFAASVAAGEAPLAVAGGLIWDMAAAAWAAVAPLLAAAAPFIALGLAVAAVSAGLYLFFTRTSQGQAMLKVLVDTAKNLWNVFVAALQPAIQQIGAEIKRLQPVWAQMGALWQAIQPIVMGFLGWDNYSAWARHTGRYHVCLWHCANIHRPRTSHWRYYCCDYRHYFRA